MLGEVVYQVVGVGREGFGDAPDGTVRRGVRRVREKGGESKPF